MPNSPRLASLSLLALATLPLTAACNEVETGENGVVEFIPDECGATFCDLDDGLAVDATTEVYLDGVGDNYVDDLTVESSAPWIAQVIAIDGGLTPRVTIAGNAEGEADLLAIDRNGYVVDFITIEVKFPDALSVDVEGANVNGPNYTADPDIDDLYFVAAGTSLDIDVTALADGSPLMGQLSYGVQLDSDLAFAVDAGDAVDDGHFRLTAPAGEHDLVIMTSTAWRTIRFSVQ